MAVSKTRTLISSNQKLAALPKPYNQYYAYYTLGIHFGKALREFLEKEEEYVNTLFTNLKPPYNASDFLSPYERATVDTNTCKHLSDFLNGLMGKEGNAGDTGKIIAFDFKKIEAIMEPSGFLYKKLTPRRIQDFWLKARRSTYLNDDTTHMDPGFLDLLSAFCGFDNFEAYLNRTFGEEYQADRDDTYQALITGSALNLSQTPSPKSFDDDPTELVAVTVDEPAPGYFFGRDDDLVKVKEKLYKRGILVVNGEGGMGKTTAAAAYYHRSFKKRRYKNMAWLFCGQGTLSSIYRLAPALGLDFRGLDDGDKLLIIQHSLKAIEKDFLLVLDNVDNDLADFMMEFQGFKWHLLITGRARLGWETLGEYELPPLYPQAAKALFKKHYRSGSGEPFESGEEFEGLLDKLISAIGYNTLLIEVFSKQLANEFYDHGTDKFGIREFLDRLEQKGLYLADTKGQVRTNYTLYRREKVATTTEILDILYDFSNLDNDLRRLLVNLALLPAEDHSLKFLFELFEPQNKGTFQNHLQELFSMGWINGDGRNRFGLNSVIQSLALEKNRETLWEDGKGLVERVAVLIESETNKDNHHTKHKWFPIADSLERNLGYSAAPLYGRFLDNFALLLKTISGRENRERAAELLEKTIASGIKSFGEETPTVATSRYNLALVLQDLGEQENLERAAKLLEKTIASGIKSFGEEAPTVATSRYNLALVRKDLVSVRSYPGFEQVTEFLEKAIASGIKNFDEETPIVATSRYDHSSTLRNAAKMFSYFGRTRGGRGNFQRAAHLLEKALESDIKNFGEEAPTVATSRAHLAAALKDIGGRENLEWATELLERTLDSDIKNFGEDAPRVAIRRSNLALALKDLGGRENLQRAAELLEKALDSGIKKFAEDETAVATIRFHLAAVLRDLGGRENLLRARAELLLALPAAIRNFGEDHSITNAIKSLLRAVEEDLNDI